MNALGAAALAAALLTSIYAVVAALIGARTGDRRWVDSSRRAYYAIFGLLLVAVVALEAAFLRSDFSLELVAGNSSTTTPTLYKVTAMWGEPGWLAAALGVRALDRRLGGALRDAQQPPRAGAVGDGGDGRRRHLLPRPDDGRNAVPERRDLPVRDARGSPGAARGRRPESPAASPGDGDPPADALLGIRLLHGPVRVRDRRADHPASRRQLDPLDPALRADRLGLPLDRTGARRALVLQRARLGRLLGLGSGRERGPAAVADGHRLHPFDHGPGATRHAPRLERLADRRHLRALAARHLPRPLRRPAVDPRLRRVEGRAAAAGADRDRR